MPVFMEFRQLRRLTFLQGYIAIRRSAPLGAYVVQQLAATVVLQAGYRFVLTPLCNLLPQLYIFIR